MIRKLQLFEGHRTDPYYNLAVEQHLLETVGEKTCILYLWQNENTVVIGKNQNAWKECRTALLEQEGGRLARRLSGGGAVFHDLGNLNFTFLMPQPEYDLDRQLAVIEQAVQAFGIPARRSGRNDVLVGDRKFSGNAFYKNGKQAYHHGTLLVSVDMQKLTRYLTPSKAKLEAKGVDSVRSRVCNLSQLCPDITIPGLKQALTQAFSQVYSLPVEPLSLHDLDQAAVEVLRVRNQGWEWNYGPKLPFSFQCEGRFPWGGVQITLQVEHGAVKLAKVYSDAMDWQLAPVLEQAVMGSRFTREALQARLLQTGLREAEDLCRLLESQEL